MQFLLIKKSDKTKISQTENTVKRKSVDNGMILENVILEDKLEFISGEIQRSVSVNLIVAITVS